MHEVLVYRTCNLFIHEQSVSRLVSGACYLGKTVWTLWMKQCSSRAWEKNSCVSRSENKGFAKPKTKTSARRSSKDMNYITQVQ